MRTLRLLIAALAALIIIPGSAAAGDEITYQTYSNSRFGFAIKYPAHWVPQPAPENNDGRRFDSPDGRASLSAWGSFNALEDTIGTGLQREFETPGRKITYKVLKKDWYVVSGYENGNIFYQKTILKDDVFYSFLLVYPPEDKSLFDPVVAAVAKSFKIP